MPFKSFGVVVVAGAILAGCRSRPVDYHVQVRNDTSGVVRALVLRDSEDRIIPVHETTVFPQARGEVSLQRRPSRERLTLQVDSPNNPAAPAQMPLSPGQSIISVTRQGEEGPVKLELLKGR